MYENSLVVSAFAFYPKLSHSPHFIFRTTMLVVGLASSWFTGENEAELEGSVAFLRPSTLTPHVS
jgi:hypothetical protein